MTESSTVFLGCIGDSLSTGFALGTKWESVRSAHFDRNDGWFNSSSAAVCSLVDQLRGVGGVRAVNFSTVSARVLPNRASGMADLAFRARHLDAQVAKAISELREPAVIGFWIGHNDLDTVGLPPRPPEQLGREVADQIYHHCGLLAGALQQKGIPGTLLIFGLIDFRRFFAGRDEAEHLRKSDPDRFPAFEACYDIFPSMLPAHRQGMIELAEVINARLRTLVLDQATTARPGHRVRIVYSDALHDADIGHADMLSSRDAWHPAPAGRRELAQAALPAFRSALDFL
jgi:lysophospholipase L1-like esterase